MSALRDTDAPTVRENLLLSSPVVGMNSRNVCHEECNGDGDKRIGARRNDSPSVQEAGVRKFREKPPPEPAVVHDPKANASQRWKETKIRKYRKKARNAKATKKNKTKQNKKRNTDLQLFAMRTCPDTTSSNEVASIVRVGTRNTSVRQCAQSSIPIQVFSTHTWSRGSTEGHSPHQTPESHKVSEADAVHNQFTGGIRTPIDSGTWCDRLQGRSTELDRQ
jgi:hypothetical protein